MKTNSSSTLYYLTTKQFLYLVTGLLLFMGSVSNCEVSAQTVAVENADKFPSINEMTFSLIQTPWRRKNANGTFTPYNQNHNKVKPLISNKGTTTLTINKATVSNTAAWKVTLPQSLPMAIKPGNTISAIVEFIAKDQSTRVKVVNGKLTISSNDRATPLKEVILRGLWQKSGEGSNEPWAQEIINSFGFKTNTGFGSTDGSNKGTAIVANSDEIISATFLRADASKPVSVIQMAAYHGCCSSDLAESFAWYPKGSSTVSTVFLHNGLDGQSLLPRKSGSTTALAQGTFNPSGAFGFKVGTANSDRLKNFERRIGLRIWKARNSSGNIIPNAYIVANDYLGTAGTNYDYQDDVYYVSNLKPDVALSTLTLAATPATVDFGSLSKGSSRTLSFSLKNPGSTGQATLKITGMELIGPNRAEFAAAALSTTTLVPQAKTTANITFRPTSRGLKNAAVLVHYNGSGSPLRVPLYGIANETGSTIALVKRVKGGSDANMTIAGNVWESDRNYRKGSIKVDNQATPGPIAATNQPVLYQSYLSAAANLAETREEIPVANGTYYVRLHFAENYYTTSGSRVFNVNIEGQTRLSNFDIYREVGYRAALVKDFETTVKDGVLTLKFNPTVNRLVLSDVEVFKISSAKAATARVAFPGEGESLQQVKKPGLQLRVSPNPNHGDNILVKAVNFASQEVVTFTLYNLVGHSVEAKTGIADMNGTVTMQMGTRQRLNRGLYILKGRAISGDTQTKLLVE